MYKISLILCFVLTFANEINCQAAIDIPLIAREEIGGPFYEMSVGLDLTATNCIDPQLGELELFSPPPALFIVLFDLAPYGCGPIIVLKDYRNAPEFPFNGTKQHTLIWQRSQPGTSINLEYNIPNEAQMRITDEFGGSLLNIGPFMGTGVAVIPGTYPLNSAFLYMDYTNIVPVELTSFTSSVLQNKKSVQLNWSTATEINNSGFEVLRFTQKDTWWREIGFVPGFGTTTEPKSYSFTDDEITTGTYKYRLKQIDFDGSFEYSKELEVEVDFTPKEYVLYQNFPNPFNPSTAIKYSLPVESSVKIIIYNSLGEMIETLVSGLQSQGNYEVEWNAQNYASGVYYYSFEVASSDGFQSHREMKKIVFLK